MMRYLLVCLSATGLLLAGCASHYGVVETDAERLTGCDYIGTFAETADPGREDGGFLKHYVDTTGVKRRVLNQAARSGATHVAWMHTFSVAAAAQAYRCPDEAPRMTEAPGFDGIWEEDLP